MTEERPATRFGQPAYEELETYTVGPEPPSQKERRRLLIQGWPPRLWLPFMWGRVLGWLDGWRR